MKNEDKVYVVVDQKSEEDGSIPKPTGMIVKCHRCDVLFDVGKDDADRISGTGSRILHHCAGKDVNIFGICSLVGFTTGETTVANESESDAEPLSA